MGVKDATVCVCRHRPKYAKYAKYPKDKASKVSKGSKVPVERPLRQRLYLISSALAWTSVVTWARELPGFGGTRRWETIAGACDPHTHHPSNATNPNPSYTAIGLWTLRNGGSRSKWSALACVLTGTELPPDSPVAQQPPRPTHSLKTTPRDGGLAFRSWFVEVAASSNTRQASDFVRDRHVCESTAPLLVCEDRSQPPAPAYICGHSRLLARARYFHAMGGWRRFL